MRGAVLAVLLGVWSLECAELAPHTHTWASPQHVKELSRKAVNSTRLDVLLPECPVSFTPPDTKLMHDQIRRRVVTSFMSGRQGIIYVKGPTDNQIGLKKSTWEYLTGVRDEEFHAVIDIGKMRSYLFSPKRSTHWAVWEGIPRTPAEWQDIYGFDEVHYSDDINTIVAGLQWSTVYILSGDTPPFSTSGKVVDTSVLSTACRNARPVKNAIELEVIRLTSAFSSEAHNMMMKYSKLMKFEYNYAALFHYLTQLCGSFKVAYESIVGAGEAASVLHYTDIDRPVKDGQLILIDAGSEWKMYATDITRTFPVSGTFTPDMTALYNAVLETWNVAAGMTKPGASWSAIGSAATDAVLNGLLTMGVVQGTVAQLRSAGINRLFYPHSLGHSVGIDVHDAGSISTLAEGMVLTIEPGIYFNEFAIEPAFSNPNQNPYLIPNRIRSFYPIGGVRIEDTGVVTANGYLSYATSPKTIPDIEALMNS